MVVVEREAKIKMVRWDFVYLDDPARRVAAHELAARFRFPLEERVVREDRRINPDMIQLFGPQDFKQVWFSITHRPNIRALSDVTRGRVEGREDLEKALSDSSCTFTDAEKKWLRGSYEFSVARRLEKKAEEERRDQRRNIVRIEEEEAAERLYARQMLEAGGHRKRGKELGGKDLIEDSDILPFVTSAVEEYFYDSRKN